MISQSENSTPPSGSATDFTTAQTKVPGRHALDRFQVWLAGLDRFKAKPVDGVIAEMQKLLLDDSRFTLQRALALNMTGHLIRDPDRNGEVFGQLQHFLRELWWIASGQVYEALKKNVADRESLARMVMHPEALEMARLMLDEGVPAFERELNSVVDEQQARTWSWLRDQVLTKQIYCIDGVTRGKAVAIWKPHAKSDEFLVSDSQIAAGKLASERWMAPMSMIAVTVVDSEAP